MNLIIAAISSNLLVNAVIWVIIGALIFFLVNWAIGYIGIPEPFNKIAKAIAAIIAVVFLINALLTVAGKPFITL